MMRYLLIALAVMAASACRAQSTDADSAAGLLDRPESPLIEAREGPPTPKSKLPAERSMVINRKARLELDNKAGWYRVTFAHEDGKPDEAPRFVLLNTRMERIEEILQEHPDVVFTVSGETTNYDKKAFLIIRLAVAEIPPKATTRPAPTPASVPSVAPATMPADPKHAATSPGAATKKAKSSTDPDSIIRAMLEERPGTPVLAPSETSSAILAQPSVAPLPEAVKIQLPTMFGTMVNDRIVRLAQDKDGWRIVRFETDNTLQEQPIRVLPNEKLAEAQKLSISKTGIELKLVVSGELTQYKGRQYLLIRRVEKYRNLGQF